MSFDDDVFGDWYAALAMLDLPQPPPSPPPETTEAAKPSAYMFDSGEDPFDRLFATGPVPIAYTPANVPVFSSVDIDIWGPPQDWGFTSFEVVEARETASPLVTDYKMEREFVGMMRPKHRYSRRERFVVTAMHLLGNRSVPQKVMTLMTDIDFSGNVWEEVRMRMKANGYRKYYNSIPFVLRQLGVKGVPQVGNELFRKIVADFMRLSDLFDRSLTRLGRKYFPNIRFVALKLFEVHGVVFGFDIPKVRTVRKKDSLEDMWTIIY